jgi:hypothetical protein
MKIEATPTALAAVWKKFGIVSPSAHKDFLPAMANDKRHFPLSAKATILAKVQPFFAATRLAWRPVGPRHSMQLTQFAWALVNRKKWHLTLQWLQGLS